MTRCGSRRPPYPGHEHRTAGRRPPADAAQVPRRAHRGPRPQARRSSVEVLGALDDARTLGAHRDRWRPRGLHRHRHRGDDHRAAVDAKRGSLLDLAAAIATGFAGAVGLARRDVAAVLPGVAIAISSSRRSPSWVCASVRATSSRHLEHCCCSCRTSSPRSSRARSSSPPSVTRPRPTRRPSGWAPVRGPISPSAPSSPWSCFISPATRSSSSWCTTGPRRSSGRRVGGSTMCPAQRCWVSTRHSPASRSASGGRRTRRRRVCCWATSMARCRPSPSSSTRRWDARPRPGRSASGRCAQWQERDAVPSTYLRVPFRLLSSRKPP